MVIHPIINHILLSGIVKAYPFAPFVAQCIMMPNRVPRTFRLPQRTLHLTIRKGYLQVYSPSLTIKPHHLMYHLQQVLWHQTILIISRKRKANLFSKGAAKRRCDSHAKHSYNRRIVCSGFSTMCTISIWSIRIYLCTLCRRILSHNQDWNARRVTCLWQWYVQYRDTKCTPLLGGCVPGAVIWIWTVWRSHGNTLFSGTITTCWLYSWYVPIRGQSALHDYTR